jgi:hypothetical protein
MATITIDGITYTVTDPITIEHLRTFVLTNPL